MSENLKPLTKETGELDILAHYGIKGMRWGVRRVDPSGKSSKKEEESEDYKKSREQKARPTSSLSNNELKNLNNRLQLEKTYKEVTGTNQSVIKRGMKPAKEVLEVGTTLAAMYTLYNSSAGKAARSAAMSVVKKVIEMTLN